MTLIRPARFSWVTELVLTSRRRGQLWLSAVNFSAIQSHRAFHIDLWLATGPSTGYCPIRRLYRQVALKWVFPPGRLDPPTGFYGVPTESWPKTPFLGSYPRLTTSFVQPHCGRDDLSLLNLPLAVYNPDDVGRLESSHVEQIRRSGRLGRGCCVAGYVWGRIEIRGAERPASCAALQSSQLRRWVPYAVQWRELCCMRLRFRGRGEAQRECLPGRSALA